MRAPILFSAAMVLLASAPTLAQDVVLLPRPVVSGSGRVLVQPGVRPHQRAALRRQLAARRALNLRRFEAYARRGSFPDNHVRPGMLNVMIDDEGELCAAANLMALDGLASLVRQTADRDNYLRFANVQQGPLMAWILSSGLSQEEIDQVQEPYDFIPPDEPDLEPRREQLEKQRLQARFREVAATLRRNRERSLDVALERLLVWRARHGVALNAPVQPVGDPSLVVAQPVRPPVIHPRPIGPPRPRPVPVVVTGPRSPLVWAPGMPPLDRGRR